MDVGSLADWVAGIGGFLAALAAVVAWRTNKRMLDVEESRDAAADERARQEEQQLRKAQAGLIFALGAKLPQNPENQRWAIYLFNGSSKPVYDICVESKHLKESAANPPLRLGALPPGRFVVPRDPQFQWGSLTDLSLSPQEVEFLVRGKGREMITAMTFSDAAGEHWNLDGGTVIQESDSGVGR